MKHSVLPALCAGGTSTRQCGLQFWGEILIATPEPKNNHNRHAVCVKKDGEIVGHIPGIECSLLYSGHFHAVVHTMSSRLSSAAPLIIIMNVIKSGTYSRAATKRSVASIQVNTGTIYLLVQVDDEYRYGCPVCTGTGVWKGWKQAFV